jgi:poly(hydroxyalkanoate) granule-associated protein
MSKTATSNLQQDLRESARKIWLAGLGALATAEDQGTKVFQNLVEKGEEFESRSEKQFSKVKSRVKSVTDKAEAQWDKIESAIDEKVTAAVQRLGIPSRDEVRTLTRRVEELTKKVEQLKPKTAKKTTKKRASKKTATA